MHVPMLGVICLGEIEILINIHLPVTVGADVTDVTIAFGHMTAADASIHWQSFRPESQGHCHSHRTCVQGSR
jgi:hypothetical protein